MHVINAFWKDSKASVAITSAILISVIVILVGAIADFGYAYNFKRQVQAALDAALLSAASEARAMIEEGAAGDAAALMESRAEAFFKARLDSEAQFTYSNLAFEADSAGNSLSIKGTVDISYDYFLLPLANIDSMEVTVSSGANVSLPNFLAIDFLVDGSGSMGIGATFADQDKIHKKIGCAIACHTKSNSAYAKAQASGGVMRIDVVRNAIAASVDIIEDAVDDEERVALGVHVFSTGPIQTIQASTAADADDWSKFRTTVSKDVQLAKQWTGTNVAYAVSQLSGALPNSGGGLAETDRKRYVIILSDFVENSQSCTNSQCWFVDPNMTWTTPLKKFANHERIQPPALGICNALKTKGITVYVINTTYLIPWGHPVSSHDTGRFKYIEDSVLPVLNDRLVDCAGDASHVINATSVAEIEAAIESVVRSTISPLHLYRD